MPQCELTATDISEFATVHLQL